MTIFLREIYLCITLSFLSILAYGQFDTTQGTLDLRNNLRSLNLKSVEEASPDMLAFPIFDQKAKIKIPFVQESGQSASTVIIGDQHEVYLLFKDFHLRKRDTLTAYGIDQPSFRQTFTSSDNKESGRQLIGPFIGDIALELNQDDDEQPALIIQQAYARTVNVGAMEFGFASSFDCHININCEEGSRNRDQKRAVMRIRMVGDQGVALCTGTLMNNTSGDRSPLVLTAYHCTRPPDLEFEAFFDMWLFDFNYESFSCANPEEEPQWVELQGAELLSEWEDTDMMLVRILEDIPASANVFYAGWNRDLSYEPDTSYLIHHPRGDIKKISIDTDTAKIHDRRIGWDNGSNSPEDSHFINNFDGTTFEGGSSGASIFDRYGHVVGQLHGGPLSDEFCTVGLGYNGRVAVSWDAGEGPQDRLRDWLDPSDFGFMQIDGLNPQQVEFVRVTGVVRTADGLAIPAVRVSLTGDLTASFLTGADGHFAFDNIDPGGSYQITLTKNTNHGNGLSSSDLVIIKNHIIGRVNLDNQFRLRAADVSQDDNISSVDLVQMTNVILGRQDTFPLSPSWDFVPNSVTIDISTITSTDMELNIVGFKLGDVNFSANPTR